jgi:hypothetical protein
MWSAARATWVLAGIMTVARSNAAATLLFGQTVLVSGGSYLATAELYKA